MPSGRSAALLAFSALLSVALVAVPSSASHAQNDAGVSGDAGNSISTARPVTPYGLYAGELSSESSDSADVYSFPVTLGQQINIEIRTVLTGGYVFAPDNYARLAFRLLGPQGVLLDTPTTNQGDTRVALAAAPATGTYYFQVVKPHYSGTYQFCFVVVSGTSHSCPDVGMRPLEVFADSLRQAKTRVLLFPPQHGDLGNPLGGPTRDQYLAATLESIHQWEVAIDAFRAEYPAYNYLDAIDIDVQVYDGVQVTANYDVAVAFVESGGTAFRGAASPCLDTPRCIVLSLFSSSPRGGQLVPDYPEINDLKAVTMHEFGHTFGIGHTLTWSSTLGPDLMNSPATFVYGDGNPAGDGGERTPTPCITSLDLYVLAKLYEWLPSGTWDEPSANAYSLPSGIPYKKYC